MTVTAVTLNCSSISIRASRFRTSFGAWAVTGGWLCRRTWISRCRSRLAAGFDSSWTHAAIGRLIGEHPGRGSSVINYSTEEAAGWLDFYTVQSGHRPPSHDVPDWMRQAYERQPVKPVFNGEPLYESHNLGLENAEVRWAHWVSVFSGACAVSYGCQGFWGIGIDVPARGRRPSRASDWWEATPRRPAPSQIRSVVLPR